MNKKINMSKIFNILMFIIGVFIIALSYNVFIEPNNLVPGGTTGLGIVFEKVTGLESSTFILISGVFLIIVSFLFLGFEKTKRTIAGTLLYSSFIYLTVPIAQKIIPYVNFDDIIVTVVIAGFTYGLGNAVVYKEGFTTGGFDVVMQLLNKYCKMPEGKASVISNIFVIILSLPIMGVELTTYSAVVVYLTGEMVNKLTIGISDSKIFFVYTKKIEEVRDALIKDLNIGFTILPTIGGYSHYKGEMIMCVIPTNQYYEFRQTVLNIDKNAFFVINDCYEVNGGYKKQHLPFL